MNIDAHFCWFGHVIGMVGVKSTKMKGEKVLIDQSLGTFSSKKSVEFLDWQSDYYLVKKDCVPCS
jgi:hypothetical protein